ncbi:MAG: cyclase family protein [Flavobacteriales bacterium]|nr:cyclase family protein [Flavobacteriales bacterium]
MTAQIETGHRQVRVDLASPLPISIRLSHGKNNPVAWYAPYPSLTPVEMEGFVGNVALGGSVNTNDITFNPHGNGTHTECIGHLTKEAHQVDEYMRDFIHLAQVFTVTPHVLDADRSEFQQAGDRIIRVEELERLSLSPDVKALAIRTLPNTDSKKSRVYTGQNPPYFDPAALAWVRAQGIEHLLVDLPSVDRENDGGKMLAHRAFWYENDSPRMHATITEFIYIPDEIVDGEYLLNIMIAPFGNDASPSKPTLYRLLP